MIRLRTDASPALIVVDLVVIWLALSTALAPDGPAWLRVVGGVVAVVAAGLAVRAVLLMLSRR